MKTRSTMLLMVAYFMLGVWARAAQDKDWGPFDRLLATQYFLNAVYPDLNLYEGLLTLRAVEFRTATGQGDVVDLTPCHPGSGVVYHPNLEQGQEPLPRCGDGRLLTGVSGFLSMYVTFGIKYPIRAFGVYGAFAHAKSDPVEKLIAAHPEWNDQQRLQALRQANPRFGPDHKREFLKAVPTEAISKFTGCRLQLDSAEFFAVRQEREAHSATGTVAWQISGLRQREHSVEEDTCVARFEPFDGKLIYAGDF